jgi:AcrR family transcriptional regulator
MKSPVTKLKGAGRFQRQREQTASDLLEAARNVLAAKGYHGTKIVDIARHAGIGVGTFYLYYPTKEAIFVALVEDSVRRLKAELDGARARHETPLERSHAATETFFHFAQENRELFRIVFGHEASFHDVVRRSQEMFTRDVMENLADGMRSGAFRDGDERIWAQAFIGMSLQVVSWWVEQEGVSLTDVTRSLSDLAFHGVVAPSAKTDERGR